MLTAKKILKKMRELRAPKSGPARDLYFLVVAHRDGQAQLETLRFRLFTEGGQEAPSQSPVLVDLEEKQDRRLAQVAVLICKVYERSDVERRRAIDKLHQILKHHRPQYHLPPKPKPEPVMWKTRHGLRENPWATS